MPRAPLVCLDLWCKAGSYWECQGEEGLAHFLEHMVFKGSNGLATGQFDRRIEALGGSSNAATGFDDVHFHVTVPPEACVEALELLLDLVLDPALQAEAFAMEREVVLEEIAQYRDQPEENVIQKLLKGCCLRHPYGRPILGFKNSLRTCTPEGMADFHQRRYRGSDCCFSAAGSLPSNFASRLQSSRLAALQPVHATTIEEPGMLPFQIGRQDVRIRRLRSARLFMAWSQPPALEQQELVGADLATTLLAEGRRSRLVQRLREELQIVESIDMDLTTLEQGSLVVLEACCRAEDIERVEQEVRTELIRAIEMPITASELRRAKRLVRNSLCFSLEAPAQVAGAAGTAALWGRKHPLLAPLDWIGEWSAERLQTQLMPQLDPVMSHTLTALPVDV